MENNLIQEARQTNLVAYLQAKGVELKKKGIGSYCLVEHDSLCVTGFKFNWFSRGISGNSLDYAMQVEGMDFRAAVEALTGKSLQSESSGANQHKQILAYLCKTRGIDYKLVTQLIKAGYINTDSRNNCVFNIFRYRSRLDGGKGEIVGTELHGSSPKRPFKGFSGGFKHGNGFNIGWGIKTAVKRLYAFESAIDLLSFITLVQRGDVDAELSECLFLSLGGLKPDVLNTALTSYEVQEEVLLCVDNDSAGNEFVEGFKGIEGFTVMQPKEIYKDWNDRLTGNCG